MELAKIEQIVTELSKSHEELKKITTAGLYKGKIKLAEEDLERWELRTFKYIRKLIDPTEAERFKKKHHKWRSVRAGEYLHRQSTTYDSYIKSLIENIKEHPEDFTADTSQTQPGVDAQSTVSETSQMRKKVFVIHGRNLTIRNSIFQFLRAVGVEPIEWTEAKHLTGKASPYIKQILETAFAHAQAIIALFTPDDMAKLTEKFQKDSDPEYEKELTGQARPNVIFETGMAFGFSPNRTIIVEYGKLRPFSDISGIHTIKFDGSATKRQELVTMLKTAGVSAKKKVAGLDILQSVILRVFSPALQ